MKQHRSPTADQTRVALAMTALAHPRRVMIYAELAAHPEGLSYSALQDGTELSSSSLNHHLRPMRAAKLVTARRKGKEVIYAADPRAIAPALAKAGAIGRNV